jgi:hypothetical protein
VERGGERAGEAGVCSLTYPICDTETGCTSREICGRGRRGRGERRTAKRRVAYLLELKKIRLFWRALGDERRFI